MSPEEIPQPPSTQIGQLLLAPTIWTNAHAKRKSELFRALIERIHQIDPSLPLERAFQSVMEREKVSSTFTDSGLALPHARLPKLGAIRAALAILPNGFEEQHPNTHFVFLFLSPEKALAPHLQVLSKASWLFQDAQLKEKLLQTKDGADALALIQETETQTPHGS